MSYKQNILSPNEIDEIITHELNHLIYEIDQTTADSDFSNIRKRFALLESIDNTTHMTAEYLYNLINKNR